MVYVTCVCKLLKIESVYLHKVYVCMTLIIINDLKTLTHMFPYSLHLMVRLLLMGIDPTLTFASHLPSSFTLYFE